MLEPLWTNIEILPTNLADILGHQNVDQTDDDVRIYEVWILQNQLKLRLHCLFLILKISISVVNCLEYKISSYLRKWLNIHQSTTNKYLFFDFPLPSAIEEFNINTQISQSQRANFSGSTSQLKCGFWDVTEEVLDAESRLEFQNVIGYHQTSTAGFGSIKTPSVTHRNSLKYRRLISDLVCEADEDAYKTKSVQFHFQDYWDN